MQKVWGSTVPIKSEDYPAPQILRNRLKRCKCGQMTFLDLPCRACGNIDLEPAFVYARRQNNLYKARNGLKIILYLAAASVAMLLIWPPLVILVAIAAIIAAVSSRGFGGPDVGTCFWLFHDSQKFSGQWYGIGNTPMADPDALDALTAGYDGDLLRLERMLDDVPDAEHALAVFHAVRSMAEIYHNHRVSMLLMRSLMLLPLSDGIRLDLDQICCFLRPEDFDDDKKLLEYLYEGARFTCICPGEATARCLARLCAVRIQREELEKHPEWTVDHCAQARPMETYFDETECKMVTNIWLQSAIGKNDTDSIRRLELWEQDPEYIELRSSQIKELSPGSNAVADLWFDRFWYNSRSEQRRSFFEMVYSHCDSPADHFLLLLWNGHSEGVAEQ